MCSGNSEVIEGRDEYGRAVYLCSECGAVYVVIHHCDAHVVIEAQVDQATREAMGVDDDTAIVLAFGDVDQECQGETHEAMSGKGVARAAAPWN